MLGKTTATNLQRAPGDDGAVASFRVSLSTVLRFGGRDRPRTATVASLSGVFVESPNALPIGELVLAMISLGDDRGAIRALMTVERVVLPAEAVFCGGLPGMGLRFFLADERLRTRWSGFVGILEAAEAPRLFDPRAIEHRPGPLQLPGNPRRIAPRRTARFRVRLADKGALKSFYTRNVSKGGMFIATTELQERGTRIEVDVRHPISGRSFAMPAEVRWVNRSGPEEEWGMGLALLADEGASEEAFVRFINGAKGDSA